MIILFKNKEIACFNKLTNRFPELLAQAQINLTPHAQALFLDCVQKRIKSNYFPSLGDSLSTLCGAMLLVPLLVMATTNKAVSTLDTYAIPELQNIEEGKINLLDGLIHAHILDEFRNHAEEARIKAEAEQRRRETPHTQRISNHRPPSIVTPRAPVVNTPQLAQFTARSNGHRERNNNNPRNNNQIHLFGYVLMVYGLMTILNIFYKAWKAEQENSGTCPAPRHRP